MASNSRKTLPLLRCLAMYLLWRMRKTWLPLSGIQPDMAVGSVLKYVQHFWVLTWFLTLTQDVYEFIQRRSDWKKIEKTVDKTMYNLSFKDDCVIC